MSHDLATCLASLRSTASNLKAVSPPSVSRPTGDDAPSLERQERRLARPVPPGPPPPPPSQEAASRRPRRPPVVVDDDPASARSLLRSRPEPASTPARPSPPPPPPPALAPLAFALPRSRRPSSPNSASSSSSSPPRPPTTTTTTRTRTSRPSSPSRRFATESSRLPFSSLVFGTLPSWPTAAARRVVRYVQWLDLDLPGDLTRASVEAFGEAVERVMGGVGRGDDDDDAADDDEEERGGGGGGTNPTRRANGRTREGMSDKAIKEVADTIKIVEEAVGRAIERDERARRAS
ncbi:hypothetical protein JCM10212_003711, partial [Sporobolomyces blumeae]